MNRSQGAPVAATFADKASAEACRDQLKRNGFGPWMVVTQLGRDDATAVQDKIAAGAAPGPSVRSSASHPVHAVAETSDGVFRAIGRWFSGERSLRASLVEHGLSEAEATQIDEGLSDGGAVIVLDAGERADEAASILGGSATHVIGSHSERFEPYPSTTDTVPGQGDPLDRGTGEGRSGGGLGATTGFWDESGAQKDLQANDISYERPAGDETDSSRPPQ